MARGKASKLFFIALDKAFSAAGFTVYYTYIKPKHIFKQAFAHYRFHKDGISHVLSDPSGPFPRYIADTSKSPTNKD